jgi:hypothetical protein
MKRVKAQFPYDKFWLYIVHHRKENRRMANLILMDDVKVRTTISYARYLMSVKMNRFLMEDEEVDHIDDNKMNDDIINLQILSKAENKRKQELLKERTNPSFILLLCPVCNTQFNYPSRNYKFHTKRGRTRFNCSRKCAGKKL